MDLNIIRRSIEEAEAELKHLDTKLAAFESLRQRKAIVESYLSHARMLLREDGGASVDMSVKLIDITVGGEPNPAWAGAQEILSSERRPMSVGEIHEQLLKRGWEFSERWGREVVRAALSRKVDIFERVSPGVYAIRSWPDHMKVVLQGKK